MIKGYRRTAINLSRLISSLAALWLSSSALAEPPISAFKQIFSLSSTGVPFTIKAERKLEQSKDGSWRMLVSADNWLGEVSEATRFNWSDCIPQTSYYGYSREGLGRARKAELYLDQNLGQARAMRTSKQQKHFPITTTTTDKLSQTLALQCMLSRGDMALELDVADERGMDHVQYRHLGEETLKTPAGQFRAVKLEVVRETGSDRQTLLWFAPDYDFALVQMIQREAGKQHTMVLRDFSE